MIKIGILKEGKIPVDERVAIPPMLAKHLNDHDNIDVVVQRSNVRRILDSEYEALGIAMADSLEDRDVLIGVKEVPIDQLIPNKTYFFFSHTIKMQPYNKGLLKAIVYKNITLIDWECLTDVTGNRLIGFGRYAGIVGTYNGFRAIGIREKLFNLKKAYECVDHDELEVEMKKVKLPPMKILLTGRGKVANGSIEVLDEIGIQRVETEAFLNESFNTPVYCQITFEEYFKHQNGKVFGESYFFEHPEEYVSDFMRFAQVTDFFIAGHYWDSRAPYLLTRQDAKQDSFRIKYVADISCDIYGPVASTIRPSTIENPLYGYDPISEIETDFMNPDSICVMAVDNLPCELPRDASKDFGEMFKRSILPALLNDDKDGIIKGATIVKEGRITKEYAYLSDWITS